MLVVTKRGKIYPLPYFTQKPAKSYADLLKKGEGLISIGLKGSLFPPLSL
jgi:hypothetical protein